MKTTVCFYSQWNISDYFYQNRERIKNDLKATPKSPDKSDKVEEISPFDALWMCLFTRLGDLCVDQRPAVRKSAGQTLFSTISGHGGLLQQGSWKKVLWQVIMRNRMYQRKLSLKISPFNSLPHCPDF